jgi:hypothetical protein
MGYLLFCPSWIQVALIIILFSSLSILSQSNLRVSQPQLMGKMTVKGTRKLAMLVGVVAFNLYFVPDDFAQITGAGTCPQIR